jgi:transcriptional regulator of aromatic amino acid metabolism
VASHVTSIVAAGVFTFEKALVGDHPTIVKLRALSERVASSDATVLITGESGTGTEVVAEAIPRYVGAALKRARAGKTTNGQTSLTWTRANLSPQ